MEIVFITRGEINHSERFIKELSCKYLPFEVKEGAAGIEKGKYNLQVGVKPIQLWMVSFPKEHKKLMIKTLFPDGVGKPQHKKHEKWIWFIRKALGIEKIEPLTEEENKISPMPVFEGAVERIAVGIKEDYSFKDGTEAI